MKRILAFLAKQKNKQKEGERGAIVVEATIALTAYIFAIFIILSIVDIAYVQAKMQVALNSAAKEMSQYSYLYTTLNLQEHMSGSGGKSSEILESFSEVLNTISKGSANISSELSGMFQTASGTAAGDSAAEYLKDGLGMKLAKQLIKKNLVSYEGDTAEAFLKRNHVSGGLSGLNFAYTSFLTDVNQSEIDLVVTYKVEVVRLLNMDYEFTFVQRARTKAWGAGVSLINPSDSGASDSSAESSSSIWDAGDLSRGEEIVKLEKKNYTYTSSKNGFHAYNVSGNEFVKIRSIDTTAPSYSGDNAKTGIKRAINSSWNSLYSGVEGLSENITVTDSTGKSTTIKSNPDTRTYKLVIVVPEGSDVNELREIAKEIEQEKKALGYNLDVEIKPGYGSPSSADE